MPPRAVLNAKPTVRVDSQAFATINELMVAMEMHEQEGGLSSLELRFSNTVSRTNGGGGYAFEDDRVLKLGARIAVYGGDQTEPREIFAGVITGLEVEFPEIGPPELVVLAEDGLQRGRMTRRTAVYRDMTLADIARQVAQRMGLEARVDGFTSRLPVQVQLDESDLAFLRRLLARYDGDAQAVGAELHVSDRGNIDRGAIELELHKGLRRARIVADLAHQVSKITVTGWNIEQGIRIRAASQGQNLGPGSGNPGSHLLQDAIGEREEHIGHLAVTDETEARALADVAFDRRARRFVRVDGTAVGNPFLRVGSTVALSGLGDRFDNTYYVVQACHSFNAVRGYETDFQAECAFLGEAA